MKNIRIGNDIQVQWAVLTSGEVQSLESHSLRLYVKSAYNKQEITNFSVNGNVITFTFPVSMQKNMGEHAVILVDTTGDATRTVCADLAFRLVAHTSQETDSETEDDYDFETYCVELKSNILVGRPGQSAYEVWLGQGHEGTEADFVNWLRQSAEDAAADVYKILPEVQEATTAANTAKATAEAAASKANAAVESVDAAMSQVDQLVSKANGALTTAEQSAALSKEATDRANTAAENAENATTSFFNATTEVPLTDGYYTLINAMNTEKSAVHVAKAQGKNSGGLFLTFQADASTWKHYQYVGTTTDDENWYNADNWSDMADIAPGAESYIVVDAVCGTPASGAYTLATAVAALVALQASTGTTYVRKGTVISYTVGENEMEAKQFVGASADDASDTTLWKNFGGDKQVTLTQSAYDALVSAGAIDEETYYNILEE